MNRQTMYILGGLVVAYLLYKHFTANKVTVATEDAYNIAPKSATVLAMNRNSPFQRKLPAL